MGRELKRKQEEWNALKRKNGLRDGTTNNFYNSSDGIDINGGGMTFGKGSSNSGNGYRQNHYKSGGSSKDPTGKDPYEQKKIQELKNGNVWDFAKKNPPNSYIIRKWNNNNNEFGL